MHTPLDYPYERILTNQTNPPIARLLVPLSDAPPHLATEKALILLTAHDADQWNRIGLSNPHTSTPYRSAVG